ncbi:unnamed protein product [Effrenium voratum]|uniref:Uncharacterized protein n=1 Tax=Effrenium voratum TaxID=2562239 RepID=A0AA36JNE4_9DINO|nr:unnamed protein product [Effrenium voratum]
MGVRGLLKLLRQKVQPEVEELEEAAEGQPNHHLVVDFQPFAFWLLQSFQDEIASWDFEAAGARAQSFVQRLRRCGVACEFVDDGARGTGGLEKLDEWKSRANEQLRDVRKLKEFLEGTGAARPQLQRGALFTHAVQEGLRAAGARVQVADGEADPVLALRLSDPKTLAILGNDTDFVLMRHGKFVHLDELDQAKWLNGHGPLRVPIWTRQALADTLKVPEEVLPMAAALCGNDHSRGLIDRCRKRGLPGPTGGNLSDDFQALAKLLQDQGSHGGLAFAAALGLLSPALPTADDAREAEQVLHEVQKFYCPSAELLEKPRLECKVSAMVHDQVHAGDLPKWCFPLAAHGLYYGARLLEDPGIGSSSCSRLLQLKEAAFGILAPRVPQGVQVRLLGPSNVATFRDEVATYPVLTDLLSLQAWPLPQRLVLWAKCLGSPLGLPEPEPSEPSEPSQLSEPKALREVHLWALRWSASASHLKLDTAELEALLATALLLIARAPRPGHMEKASWRCTCLGMWYQQVIGSILDLARIMKVLPAVSPARLFHGPTFQQLLLLFARHPDTPPRRRGKMGFRGPTVDLATLGNSEEELLKIRETATFRAWREEVLQGLQVEVKKSEPACTVNPFHTPDMADGVAPGVKGLPIEAHKAALCATLLQHRVTCVHGETGSGKSTQVPQYLLELFDGAQIAVTQPRRMAAINLAKRVAKERGEALGETVGYRIGGDSAVGRQLNFQTTGWLLRALVSDTNRLGKLTHVVFDEIHERSADADFLSLVVRLLLHRFPTVRLAALRPTATVELVIMSATLQANLFRSYFRELQLNEEEVPVVPVGGRCFKVQPVFLDELQDFCGAALGERNSALLARMQQKFKDQDMATKSSQALAEFCSSMSPLVISLLSFLARPRCTILVFLPGILEITSIYEECQSYLHAIDGAEESEEREAQTKPSKMLEYKVFAMHSQIPTEDQMHVFQEPKPGVCHFVLASNVAESSLTLPNVCAVIDLGLHKQQVYNHRLRMTYLSLKWTSRASAHQRSGRAGRTMEGVAVRLYPKKFYEALPEFDRPETASLPLPRLYLQAKQLSSDLASGGAEAPGSACSVLSGLVDPPDLSIIEASRRELAEGHALASPEEEADMTSVGKACLSLPFDLSLCRLVWLSVHWGCAADGVILACSLSVQDPFSSPSAFTCPDLVELGQKLRRSNASRRKFDAGRASQPLALRELFKEFWHTLKAAPGQNGRRAWLKHAHNMAATNAVIPRRLTEFVAQVEEVAQRLLAIVKKESKVERQLAALLKGLGRRALGAAGAAAAADDAGYEGPTIWEQGEEVWQDVPNAARKPCYKVFEKNVAVLRALLAASFSERLMVTRKPVRKADWQLCSMAQLCDPRRSLLLTLPEGIDGDPCKFLALMTGSASANLKNCGPIGEDYLCIEVPANPDEVGKASESGDSDTDSEDLPRDILGELHIFNQVARGRQSACQIVKSKLTGEDADGEIVQLTVRRPVHPCELQWEVHAPAEEDQKGRSSVVRKGIVDSSSPLGFLCDVDSEKRDWFACCSNVAYTEGSICFPSGLTVLRQQHLKFFLLTVDPQVAGLAIRVSEGGLTGMRMHRKELQLAVSPEELRFIDAFRASLREAMLSPEALHETSQLPELRAFCLDVKDEGETHSARAWGSWVVPCRCGLAGAVLPGMEPLLLADSQAGVLAHPTEGKAKKKEKKKLEKDKSKQKEKIKPRGQENRPSGWTKVIKLAKEVLPNAEQRER